MAQVLDETYLYLKKNHVLFICHSHLAGHPVFFLLNGTVPGRVWRGQEESRNGLGGVTLLGSLRTSGSPLL